LPEQKTASVSKGRFTFASIVLRMRCRGRQILGMRLAAVESTHNLFFQAAASAGSFASTICSANLTNSSGLSWRFSSADLADSFFVGIFFFIQKLACRILLIRQKRNNQTINFPADAA
jgi:hypothetical protein